MDLVQFLRDRLDEDEAAARAATPGPWEAGYDCIRIGTNNTRLHTEHAWDVKRERSGDLDSPLIRLHFPEARDARHDAAHIVRHDPARILAEVEAKRRLLVVHAKSSSYDGCVICDDGNDSCGCMSGAHWEYPCDTVKLLTLPYADHPDYREEWRP